MSITNYIYVNMHPGAGNIPTHRRQTITIITSLTHSYSFKIQFDDVTWCDATQKKDSDPLEEWERERYHPKDNSTWQLFCLAVKSL